MKGFKECSNGHYFQPELDTCPYCPAGTATPSGNLDKTIVETDNFSSRTSSHTDLEKTVVDTPINMDKTVVDARLDATVAESESSKNNPQAAPASQQRDLSKTYIQTDDVTVDEHTGAEKQVTRARRKLVGWLVSYSIDSLGRDFRLFEGKNTVGKSTSNDIIVNDDASISGQHAIILYRNNHFYIKDNLSTNGTKINGKELEPDTSEKMEDKAEIMIGETTFTFRMA